MPSHYTMAWRERRRRDEMNADAGRTDNADGPMRPCPTPTARSAYESESTAAGAMHDAKKFSTTS